MIRVMLDTNVLVKFAFVLYKIYKNTKIQSNLIRYKFVLEKLEGAKFFNIMSDWNKLELRDVLLKLKLAENYFMSGFTVNEFKDAEEEIKLSKEDQDSVNLVVFNIWKFCEKNTENIDMRKIEHWTKKDYSSMDIILIHQAELNKCDYFVTNDRKLFNSKELSKAFNVKILPLKDFAGKLGYKKEQK